MTAIRDDGGAKSYPPSWRDALDFLESVRRQAATLQLDRSEGQPVRLIVMCEAAGMVPQLARVAHEYGVPVLQFWRLRQRDREARLRAKLPTMADRPKCCTSATMIRAARTCSSRWRRMSRRSCASWAVASASHVLP